MMRLVGFAAIALMLGCTAVHSFPLVEETPIIEAPEVVTPIVVLPDASRQEQPATPVEQESNQEDSGIVLAKALGLVFLIVVMIMWAVSNAAV
jgi:hypothetical protein